MLEKSSVWVSFSGHVVEAIVLLKLLSNFEVVLLYYLQVLSVIETEFFRASIFREYFSKVDINKSKYLMNFESVLKIPPKFCIFEVLHVLELEVFLLNHEKGNQL